MKPSYLFAIFCLSYAGWTHAEIYKRVDSKGHVTYSSERLKGSKKLDLQPLPTMPGMRSSRRSAPEDFPKVDSQTQRSRDATRRLILQDELANEEKLLAAAQQDVRNIESTPVNAIGMDGTPNPVILTQYSDKLKEAQNLVVQHEQNIKALNTELSNLK